MADETMTFVVGLAIGIAVVAVLVMALRQREGQQQAALTTHNVVRDDEGRIKTVDTLSGLPMGAQAQAPPQQPPIDAPDAPRLDEMR